jgi:hypothetical protein
MHELLATNEDSLDVIIEHLEACISSQFLPVEAIMRIPLTFFEAGNGSVILQTVEEGVVVEQLTNLNTAKQ